jgi:uncharacterized protein (TIGR03083 family)
MSDLSKGHGFDEVEAIRRHSAGLADAAEGNLDARVEHCPDWSVADLVWHLTEVQWFWATIADERLDAPADEARRPPRGADGQLVADLRAATERLATVLAGVDGTEHAWTWAPQRQDTGFIRRHQVQEAAVHHWDAVNAAGGSLQIEADVAADSVNEFLTFSVSSEADVVEPARADLDGSFLLRSTDAGLEWTVSDGGQPSTLAFVEAPAGAGATDLPTITATASDLLLWLYGRVELDTAGVPADLLERFRQLCFTD